MTQAAIFSGRVPGSTSSLATSAMSTATVLLVRVSEGGRMVPTDGQQRRRRVLLGQSAGEARERPGRLHRPPREPARASRRRPARAALRRSGTGASTAPAAATAAEMPIEVARLEMNASRAASGGLLRPARAAALRASDRGRRCRAAPRSTSIAAADAGAAKAAARARSGSGPGRSRRARRRRRCRRPSATSRAAPRRAPPWSRRRRSSPRSTSATSSARSRAPSG